VKYFNFACNYFSDYEDVIDSLKFYNPATPSTLTSTNVNLGGNNQTILFPQIVSTIRLHNNYQVPVNVTVYLVEVTGDTSHNPLTCIQNGLVNVGNPPNTSTLIYPTDSPMFRQLWKIVKCKKVIIQPGDMFTMSSCVKNLRYTPQKHDDHSSAFQRKERTRYWLFRMLGKLGHDTVLDSDQQTDLQAAVDYEHIRKYVVKYDGGSKMTEIEVDDNAVASFTNGGVVSSITGVDNVPYASA
jgi:hypothetical protein